MIINLICYLHTYYSIYFIKLLDDLYIQKSKIYEFNNEMFIFSDIVPLSRTTIIETYPHLFESYKFVISEGLNKLKL